jgi:hypothetical protein
MEDKKPLNVPILIILFNRIDTLQVLFNVIKEQKPKYLYVYGDAPRQYIDGEKEKCEQARSIVQQVDWDCNLKVNFREENSGSAGKGVSSAISWFFEQVEYGIIFEHDVIPHPDYFIFCEELLEKYKNNEKISVINGVNFQNGLKRGNGSYYFSTGSSNWGFATWKRFWKHYDLTLESYPYNTFKNDMQFYNMGWKEKLIRQDYYKLLKEKKIDDWAYQVHQTQHKLHGLAIVPNVNMVSNIGGGVGAYNLRDPNDCRLNRPVYPILPLEHPSKIERDVEADSYQKKNTILRPVIYIPKTNKSLQLNINSLFLFLLYISWRWFRRNFIAKPKY